MIRKRFPDNLIKIVLVLASSIFSLYIIEGAILSFNVLNKMSGPEDEAQERSYDTRVRLAEEASLLFDTRTKLEVIEDFEAQGIEAFPQYQPSFSARRNEPLIIDGNKVLPLAGISNVLTVHCNETGEYFIFQSDKYGFHNPPEQHSVANARIVALGDSLTIGACVPSDKNAIARLRSRYRSVLNLGISGDGPLLMLATLKEYAMPRQPETVLWFYSERTDLQELEYEKEVEILLNYLEPGYSQDLLSISQSSIDRAIIELINERRKEEVEDVGQGEEAENGEETREGSVTDKGVLAQLWERVPGFLSLTRLRGELVPLFGPEPDVEQENLELFREVLITAKNVTSSSGANLYFVYLPEWKRYAEPASASGHRDQVLQIVEALDIPVIDVHETFAAQDDPLSLFPFRQDGHYTEEGYNLVAEIVIRFIEERQDLTAPQGAQVP